jgi:hypothetical protein
MKGESKFIAGLLSGLACVTHARDKVVLHLFNPSWNQIPLQGLRGATAATRQNNQTLPYSRLGELTRCCAPVFHRVAVTQPLSSHHSAVTEMSFFCPRDVTVIRECAVVF